MQEEKVLLTPFWFIAATFVGIADTLYLAYFHLLGIVPGCAILDGCEKVLTSPYSKIFDMPLAYLGLVYYAYALALAILLMIEPKSFALRLGLLCYAGIGLLMSVAFELFQFFVIGALCMYCAISAATTLALFSIAVWHVKATK